MQTAAAVKIDPAKLTPEQHRQLWAVQQQEVTARRRELAERVAERTAAWERDAPGSIAPAQAAREKVAKLRQQLAVAAVELADAERGHAGREHQALGGIEACRRELERLAPDVLASAIDTLNAELDRARRGVPLATDDDRPALRRRVVDLDGRLREARALVYQPVEPADLLRTVERLTAGL